jgi:hypothetical protein
VVSQLDILPAIYEITGLSAPYTAFGRSLFDNSTERFAFTTEGPCTGLITAKGAIRHSGAKMLDIEPKAPDFDAKKAEETLLSFDKAALTLLKNNKWFKYGE